MNKELEALEQSMKKLVELMEIDNVMKLNHSNVFMLISNIEYGINQGIQALTPPNKEELKAEIIKELNEINHLKSFYYDSVNCEFRDETGDIYIGNMITIKWNCNELPLSLASKIIKFFELGDE